MVEQKTKENETSPIEAKKFHLQTIIITNPNNPTKQAVLNIYFMDDDIVFGGIGWYEYFDYEKVHNKKEKTGV